MVVKDIPPELEKKICATMTFSEAVYLLKQSQAVAKTDSEAHLSLVKWTEKVILIRNVACFCRKPTKTSTKA